MPHALSERQKEYLNFIREYIRANEMSPGLDEIARHFDVKSPTAHKILEALQAKGFIYFVRSSEAGFYIRLVERAGMHEVVMPVPIFGKVDYLGEIQNFPEYFGGFDDFFFGGKPNTIFAVVLTKDIPIANMKAGDTIVFDQSKKPQPGDICILPIGQRLFLAKIASKTMDREVHSVETSIKYPIPVDLCNPNVEQLLNYYPLAFDENTEEILFAIAEDQDWPLVPLPTSFAVATALHLWRKFEVGG
ncbi:MAG: hypothetical protein JW908_09270 [Anaerolineales bacterium]|nr:hypothetical protein [Anaerolineales bacterium]